MVCWRDLQGVGLWCAAVGCQGGGKNLSLAMSGMHTLTITLTSPHPPSHPLTSPHPPSHPLNPLTPPIGTSSKLICTSHHPNTTVPFAACDQAR